MSKFRRVISVFFVIVFLCVGTPNSMAYSSSFTTSNTDETIAYENLNYFLQYELNIDCEIISSMFLYNNDDDIIAYAFVLSTGGYAITDLQGTIIEAQFDNSSLTEKFINFFGKIYYGGPTNYYAKNGNSFVDIVNNNVVSKETVLFNMDSFENTMLYSSISARNSNVSRGITMRYDLQHTLPTISYNPQNLHCASTAAAIVLHYFDDYRNSAIVPNYLDDATGVKLVDYLIPFIHGTPSVGGVTVREISNGVNDYFEDQNITGIYSDYTGITLSSSYTVANFFQECRTFIEADYPIIIIFNDNSSYGGHFYIIHGLLQDVSGGQYYAYLNNGAGSNNVFINLIYVNSVAIIW